MKTQYTVSKYTSIQVQLDTSKRLIDRYENFEIDIFNTVIYIT